MYFHSDGSVSDWGYKITITALFMPPPKEEPPPAEEPKVVSRLKRKMREPRKIGLFWRRIEINGKCFGHLARKRFGITVTMNGKEFDGREFPRRDVSRNQKTVRYFGLDDDLIPLNDPDLALSSGKDLYATNHATLYIYQW